MYICFFELVSAIEHISIKYAVKIAGKSFFSNFYIVFTACEIALGNDCKIFGIRILKVLNPFMSYFQIISIFIYCL